MKVVTSRRSEMKIERNTDALRREDDPNSYLFDIYLKEGRKWIEEKEYSSALQSLNKALEFRPGDNSVLLVRSRCHLAMGRRLRALRDADSILDQDPAHPEALYAKAETLFQSGNYELALIYFHRGLKLEPESKHFRSGIEKAESAVLKFGGKSSRTRLRATDKVGKRKHRKNRLRDINPRVPPLTDRTGQRSWSMTPDDFRSEFLSPLTRITKKPGLSYFRSLRTQSEGCLSELSSLYEAPNTSVDEKVLRKILGELNADREYLHRLYNSPVLSKAEEVDLAGEGISYLHKCGAYWDSLGPLPPPQPTRRKYRSTPNTPRDDTETSKLPSYLKKMEEPITTSADINFQFVSYKRDDALSAAMETDSYGPHGRSKSLLFSEPTMTSFSERPNDTNTRSSSMSLMTEFETIGKLVSNGNWSECMSRAESCLNDVEATGENEIPDKLLIIATLHSYLGNAAATMGDYTKAQHHHLKDLYIGDNGDLPDAVSRALGNLGRIYTTLRKFNEALDVLARKAPLCSNPEEVAWVFLEIGTCFLALGHHDYARDCGKKVLTAARGPNLEVHRLQALLLLGSSYERLKKLEDAKKSYRSALVLAKETGDNMAELAINRAISKVENKMAFKGNQSPKKQNVEVDFSESVISEPTCGALSNRTATSSVNTNYQSLSEVTDEFEVDHATIFSVMRRLRDESDTISANPFSDDQDLEDTDFASSLDECEEIPVLRRRSSNVYQQKSISGHKAVLRKKSISFKLRENRIDEQCYDLSTCGSMSSLSRTSRKERAALILKKRLMKIKYQKVESDWSPPHIDPARHITNLNQSKNKDPASVEGHSKYELRNSGKRDEDEVKQTIDIGDIVSSEIAEAIEDDKCNEPLEADEDESHPVELYIEGDIIEQMRSAEDFLYPDDSPSLSFPFAKEFSVHQEDLLMMATEEDLQETGLEVTEQPEEKVNEENSHELIVQKVSNTDASKAKSDNATSLEISESSPYSSIVQKDISISESEKNDIDVEENRGKHPKNRGNISKIMSTITCQEPADYADDVLTETGSQAVDGKTKETQNIYDSQYDAEDSKKTNRRTFGCNQPNCEKTVKRQFKNDINNTSKLSLPRGPLLGKANDTSQKRKHSIDNQTADDSGKSFLSKQHLFKSRYHDILFAKKSPQFQDEDRREDANVKTLTKDSPREPFFKSKYHNQFIKENPHSEGDDNNGRITEQSEQQATSREPLFKSKYHERFMTKPEVKPLPIKYEPKLYQSSKKYKDQTHKIDTQSETGELHSQTFTRGSRTHKSNDDVANESSKEVSVSEKVDKLDLSSITADGNKTGVSPTSMSNSRKILKKEGLLPALKDSPFNKPLRSPKKNSPKGWNVLKNKLKIGSTASGKRVSQLNKQHHKENELTSKKSKSDIRLDGFQKERKYVGHWLKLKGVSPRYPESDNSNVGFNDIPSYIQEKKILFRLSKKNDKIVFTPLINSELEKNWKVIYMRIRKGDKTFTVPVATDASELENIDSSAQKQKLTKQKFVPNRKLYPVQLEQKQKFKLRMNRRNLRTVEEDKEYKISPRAPISTRSQPGTLTQNPRHSKQKHVIRRSSRFDNVRSQAKRRSISLRIRSQQSHDAKSPTGDAAPASTIIKVPRGQEVVYRQEDRDGKTVLVPVVKEAAHKLVLVKVRQNDKTFILPLIVGKS